MSITSNICLLYNTANTVPKNGLNRKDVIRLRNPNGFGSVYKLPGNRRRPWAVRITVSHDMGKYRYKYLSYHSTREEALIALAEYNKDPYSIDGRNVTLKEMIDRFMEDQKPKVAESTYSNYTVYANALSALHDIPIADLKLAYLQNYFDSCGFTYIKMYMAKQFLSQVFQYAMRFEVVSKNYASLVDVAKHKEGYIPHKKEVFKPDEIELLWNISKTDDTAKTAIMMLYTGVRVSEMLDLKEEDVDLDRQCFYIRQSKTAAGVRTVPIADRILPLFEYWKTGKEYLVMLMNVHQDRRSFTKYRWDKLMKRLNMEHTCHETRHTFISMMANKGIDERITKSIVGHAGGSITENVYTHIDLQPMLDAVNKL